MPKISVIIPIYNTQNYLEKCLDSVINQTFKDIEIICVNDCSKDNSLEILKEYSKKDKRVKIIDFKENKGPASARNEALNIAKGEYIGFIDSDDWIDLDFFEKLYFSSQNSFIDIIKGTINFYFDDMTPLSDKTKKFVIQEQKIMQDLDNKIPENKMYFRCMFTSAIYKKSLLDKYNIRFIENCTCGEDLIIPIKSAFFANKIKIIKNTKYHYLRKNNSLSLNNDNKNPKNYYLAQKIILDFINNIPINKEYYNYIVENYIPQNDLFNIIKYYYNNELDLIQTVIDIHKSIKYPVNKENELLKIINEYNKNQNKEKLILELKKIQNQTILKKIRENIKDNYAKN